MLRKGLFPDSPCLYAFISAERRRRGRRSSERCCRENEKVPSGVEVGQPVERKEDDAHRVSQYRPRRATATPCQPMAWSRGGTQRRRTIPGTDRPAPTATANRSMATLLKITPAMASPHTMPNMVQPTRPAQRNQREGRIGAGDEQVDRRVVEDLEDVARARAHQRVVKRGADVNQHERARRRWRS